jgi:hypothetical protein
MAAGAAGRGEGAAPPVAGQAAKIIANVKKAGESRRQAMRRPRCARSNKSISIPVPEYVFYLVVQREPDCTQRKSLMHRQILASRGLACGAVYTIGLVCIQESLIKTTHYTYRSGIIRKFARVLLKHHSLRRFLEAPLSDTRGLFR